MGLSGEEKGDRGDTLLVRLEGYGGVEVSRGEDEILGLGFGLGNGAVDDGSSFSS